MTSRLDQDIYGFKLMFGMLILANPFLIFLDITRFDDPTQSIGIRFITEIILISVFIFSHRIKKEDILRFQSFFCVSSILTYLFLIGSDYVSKDGFYSLFLPNITTISIIINASFIGLRFRHSSIVNLLKVIGFAYYASYLSSHPIHQEQVAYLFIFYAVATILSYLFERKNRELFLKEQQIAEKSQIIEANNENLNKENVIKDSLLSILSHDVRGPLLTLESLLQLKEDDLLSEKEMLAHFQRLGNSVGTIRTFTDRTILWVKSQMKGFTVNQETVLLKSHISETLDLIEETAHAKDITIDCNIADDSSIETDKEMFSIVIRNLIMNAIKYSHPKSKVVIREAMDHSYHKIHIEDQGVGIPDHKKETLFSLETLSTDGTRKEKGTGLGLSLAYNLMVQLGGDLTFTSTEGEGSTFTMRFKRDSY